MSTYIAKACEVGPWRILCAWLPWPTWDKNDRIGVMRTGRRFMTPAAREYRAKVGQLLAPVLPSSPWYEPGRAWTVDLTQLAGAQRADVDHFLSGIMDDMIRSGLAVSDVDCVRAHVSVERNVTPCGVLWYSRQGTYDPAPESGSQTDQS